LHGGDFYDGPKNDTTLITESWKKLTAKYPVFMAPGNHEEYGDYRGFLKSIADAGVVTLEDRKVSYGDIDIVGVKYRENRGENNQANLALVDSALKPLNIDPNRFTILINHAPTALSVADKNKVDLQVSGHTHRGQFWPLNYIVYSIYKEYTYGLHPYQDLQVLTTSGVGTASVPSRLFNTPELVRITFEK
jgi:predicted MPP superfamily phosphohydrolase